MMILSLFSCFDPALMGGELSLNWVAAFVIFCSSIVWVLQTFLVMWGSFVGQIVLKLWAEINGFKWVSEGFALLFSVFAIVATTGVLGLIPYSFGVSSHLSFTLSLSLPLWVGGILFSIKKTSLMHFVGHLLPQGSPVSLWFFLVLVESVSVVIRPLTLAVRLMANVMAGHLILSLVGMGFSYGFPMSPLVVSGLVGFEMGVCVVQAYVFTTLLSLYWDE